MNTCTVNQAVLMARPQPGRQRRPKGPGHRNRAGIALIECLVYISVYVLVVGAATTAFYRAMDYSKHLRRASAQISLALDAGERWRSDIRAAVKPPHLLQEGTQTTLVIPQEDFDIVYLENSGTVSRGSGKDGHVVKILSGLKSSAFIQEPRQQVHSWRWEFEYVTQAKSARLKPLFSYQAVSGQKN